MTNRVVQGEDQYKLENARQCIRRARHIFAYVTYRAREMMVGVGRFIDGVKVGVEFFAGVPVKSACAHEIDCCAVKMLLHHFYSTNGVRPLCPCRIPKRCGSSSCCKSGCVPFMRRVAVSSCHGRLTETRQETLCEKRADLFLHGCMVEGLSVGLCKVRFNASWGMHFVVSAEHATWNAPRVDP